MRILAILLLLYLIFGCSGGQAFIRQMPVIGPDGGKTYILSNEVSAYSWTRQSVLDGYDERANKICPSGYTLINEEDRDVQNLIGGTVGGKEISWQIRCKTVEQPKS